MKGIKKLLILTAVFALVLSLVGCGQPGEGEIVLDKVQIYYDSDGYTVTVTGMESTERGVEIGVEMANKSERNFRFVLYDVSVNGLMMPHSDMSSVVPEGEKVRDTLVLPGSDLDKAEIAMIAKIGFIVDVYDDDTGELINSVGPFNLSTSAPEDYVQTVDDSGETILDEGDIRVVCKGLCSDSPWDGALVLYFENNLYKDVTFYVEEITVNDTAAEESLEVSLRGATGCMDGLTIGADEMSGVETIEFSVRAEDNYGKELAATGVLTLSFE